MNRRRFIQNSTLLSIGSLSSMYSRAATINDVGPIGIQLWSVRHAMTKDSMGTLKSLAEIGYDDVELAGYSEGKFYGMEPLEFKKVLDDLGIMTQSGHTKTGVMNPEEKNTMINNWEACIRDAAIVGNNSLVLGWIAEEERTDLDSYKRVCDLLNKCGELSKSYGIQMAYHNHDFEFIDFDGVVAYDYLLQNTDPDLVKFEMDHYWVKKGGANSIDLIDAHPGRFPYWHVKDMDDTTERFFTEVGTGVIDYKTIFHKRDTSGMKYFYVEQDEFRKGIQPLSSVKQSHDYLEHLNLG